MVEININGRSSICWRGRRELITDVRKPEIMVMTSLWRRHIDYSDHPRKLVTLNPKLKSTGAGRYQLLSRWWDAASSLAWKISPKSQDAVVLYSRLRSVALYLWLIVVYPSGNRPLQQYLGLHCRALVMVSCQRADSLIAKFKEAGVERSERLMYEQKIPRLSPLWLSASSSACHGLLIITVITPLPTKPSATKMPENQVGERAVLLTMQMRQRDVAASMQIQHELADAKAGNDALRDDCCRWWSSVVHQSSLSSVWATNILRRIMQPPPIPDTAERDYFTLRERLITMQKNNWKEPRSILMSSADRACRHDGNSCNYCEQYTRASMDA